MDLKVHGAIPVVLSIIIIVAFAYAYDVSGFHSPAVPPVPGSGKGGNV